jgi:hypothetical protein
MIRCKKCGGIVEGEVTECLGDGIHLLADEPEESLEQRVFTLEAKVDMLEEFIAAHMSRPQHQYPSQN